DLSIISDITNFNEFKKQTAITRNYLDIAAVIILILDKKGRVTLINRKGRELLQYKNKEIIGKNWFGNFIAKNISREMKSKYNKFIACEYSFPDSFENKVLTKDGQEKLIKWQNTVIRNDEGAIISTIFSGEDITEKNLLEQKLLEDEYRFRALAENTTDIIFRYKIKPERLCEYISPSIEKLTGYDRKEFKDHADLIINIIHPEDRHMMLDILDLKKKLLKPIEFRWITKENEIIWTEQNIVPICNQNKELFAIDGIVRDITDRKRSEEKIKYLSFHDNLTNLYNRAYFEEELKRLDTVRQLPLCFIMGDVNNLKLVNDSFGHLEGDLFLKNVANLMKSFCRKEDIIARWGGDEFAILLPKTHRDFADEIIERIREACKKTSRHKIPISIALGHSSKEKIDQDINSVISEAEDNMYKSKLLEKKSLSSSIIASLTTTLFEKGIETEKHTLRVRELALEIARDLKLSQSELNNISLLSTLHDIGKIAISDELLKKKEMLTDREKDTLKRHTEIGASICNSIPQLAHISTMVLSHHEHYDGFGYPQNLKGLRIPIESRIITITDAFDVMTHRQPYKDSLQPDRALEEINKLSGTQFDPVLVDRLSEIILPSINQPAQLFHIHH
ncbi:MAG: diguanylate cyclase, partial [Actinobacteria bacterium]|nr:diguanylate cyclase [Actinomycetota bacterium]